MPQCDEGKSTFFLSARCIAYSVSCRVKLVKIVFDDSELNILLNIPVVENENRSNSEVSIKNNTNVVIPLPLK